MSETPLIPDFDSRLRAARLGADDERFALLAKFRDMLVQFAERRHRHARAGSDPEGTAHETLLRALSRFDDFQGSTEGQMEGWLKTTARNLEIDSYRKQTGRANRGKKPRPHEVPIDEAPEIDARQPTPVQIALEHERDELFAAELARLNPLQRQVFQHWVDGKNAERSGELLAKSARRIREIRSEIGRILYEKLGDDAGA